MCVVCIQFSYWITFSTYSGVVSAQLLTLIGCCGRSPALMAHLTERLPTLWTSKIAGAGSSTMTSSRVVCRNYSARLSASWLPNCSVFGWRRSAAKILPGPGPSRALVGQEMRFLANYLDWRPRARSTLWWTYSVCRVEAANPNSYALSQFQASLPSPFAHSAYLAWSVFESKHQACCQSNPGLHQELAITGNAY